MIYEVIEILRSF